MYLEIKYKLKIKMKYKINLKVDLKYLKMNKYTTS